MKAFKYILFLLLILFIGMAIYIAVQPNAYDVKRTRTINAPVSVVYDNIIDFENWLAWSSWADENAGLSINLPDQTRGIDASYSWKDDNIEGTIKTINAKPDATIVQEMQYGDDPKTDIIWNLKPNGDGTTEVTLTMSGNDLPFGFKASTIFNGGMDSKIGPDIESSLEKLDRTIVANMKVYSINVEGITQHGGGFYLYNTTSSKRSDFKLRMQEMMPKLGAYAIANNITMSGKPFVIYHKMDDTNGTVMFSCCIPTTSKITTEDPEVLTGQLEPFKALKTVLKGDYVNLQEAWTKATTYIETNNLVQKENGIALEAYLNDPMSTPNPANLVTEIYLEVE
ncbi:SRPBCC family protein [Psychroserpens sp.]|uniref:SRPBCC family protein n=1 Tax=Psychroserpens sp. TaxID=2020870 RepID=UPI003C72C9FF